MFVVVNGQVVELNSIDAVDRNRLVSDVEMAQARLAEYDAVASFGGVEINITGEVVETPVENIPADTIVIGEAPVETATQDVVATAVADVPVVEVPVESVPVEVAPVETVVETPVAQPVAVPVDSVADVPTDTPAEQPAMIIQ